MKIAICYATNSGTTEKCARILAQKLECAEVFNISKRRKLPDVSGFDAIIVGSPVRMGQLHDGAVVFMNDNKALLAQKKTALFVCCSYPENVCDYFDNLFPASLVDAAVWHGSLGGELEISRMPLFDKMMMKQVMRQNGELPNITLDMGAIDELAACFK